LNHFHDVRRWLKEEKRYQEWQNLDVQWVQHHDPILKVMDENGNGKEDIDLTEYDYNQISDLLRQKGFKMKGEM